ncbi:MAG: hypothetical protein ACRCUP_07670 [Mycoplasmatales bacterium]
MFRKQKKDPNVRVIRPYQKGKVSVRRYCLLVLIQVVIIMEAFVIYSYLNSQPIDVFPDKNSLNFVEYQTKKVKYGTEEVVEVEKLNLVQIDQKKKTFVERPLNIYSRVDYQCRNYSSAIYQMYQVVGPDCFKRSIESAVGVQIDLFVENGMLEYQGNEFEVESLRTMLELDPEKVSTTRVQESFDDNVWAIIFSIYDFHPQSISQLAIEEFQNQLKLDEIKQLQVIVDQQFVLPVSKTPYSDNYLLGKWPVVSRKD